MNPWLLFVLSVAAPSEAAYIQTAQCGSGKMNPFMATSDKGSLFTQMTVDVMLRSRLLIYRLQFTAQQDIADANTTTNRLTTLNINTNFISGDVYQTSARLCDYLTVVQDSVYSGPPGGKIEPRNDTFTGDGSLGAIADLFTTASPEDLAAVSWIPGYDTKGSRVGDLKVKYSVCPIEMGTRYQIIYVNEVETDRYFGSYDTEFTFISSDGEDTGSSQVSQCFEVFVTPYHPNYITLPICFTILAIFIVGLVSTFYIYHYSPNQESSNVFLLIASSICNEPLLNELTPDVISLFHYLQFSLFSVCLNLTYPWFLPVILSYVNWVALIRVDIFSSAFINPMAVDGVYQTLGRFALFVIFPIEGKNPKNTAITEIWANFMIWITCAVVFFIILSHFGVYVSRRGSDKGYPWKKSLLNSLSVCVQFFYQFFPLPFVAISSFLLLAWFTRLKDINVAAAAFALIFLVAWCALFVRFYFGIVWKDSSKLYSSLNIITVWSSTYHYYKPELVWFLLIDKLKIFVDGVIIGMGSQNGLIQLMLLIFLGVCYTFALVYYQPFFNRRRNVWVIYLTLIQILNLMLSVTFIRDLRVPSSARSIIGDVQLLIHALVILVFMFYFILRAAQVHLKRSQYIEGWTRNGEEDYKGRPTYQYGSTNENSNEIIDVDDDIDCGSILPQPLALNKTRTDSLCSRESARKFQLTDPRVLPGLSLNYSRSEHNLDAQHRPTAVSPITYEYLQRIENQDSEVRTLWLNRLRRRGHGNGGEEDIDDSASWIKSLKRRSADLSQEKGFSVVGRKQIVGVQDGNKRMDTIITEEDDDIKFGDCGEKKVGEKNSFVVVGRKPITVNPHKE